jgi:non-specific serine/threonine protein kinase/serine/threonine-protein kinase
MNPPPESGAVAIIAGRYEVGKVLGRGGMGEVRAGKDLKLERPVAIKILHPEMAARPDFKERFAAEARAAGRLMHPNIVAVYDTGEYEGTSFIVMELLPGRTLADALATQGPFEPEAVRRVTLEILAALDASHAEGILHRDIKAGNVLLTQEGSVKVADFGVAKVAEGLDMTLTGLLLGTPAYLAPELVDGEPASKRSDIYAVGVVLYELLAGRRPFQAETPLALAMSIKRDDPVALSDIRPDLDPALIDVVDKAISKEPEDRYADAQQMAKALAAAETPIEVVDTVLPPTDSTQPLLVPGRPAPASTRVMRPDTPVAGEGPTRTAPPTGFGMRRAWVALVIAAVAILSLLVFTSALDRNDQPNAVPTDTSDGSLPPALDAALDRLEEAVRP